MVLPDLEGCSPLQPRNPLKAQRWPMGLLRQNEACIDQNRLAGPRHPPVLDQGCNVSPCPGGLQSLAAAEPNEGPTLADALLRQNEACNDQHGAEGPDALQVLIKAPMVLPDLEGCGPSQPR